MWFIIKRENDSIETDPEMMWMLKLVTLLNIYSRT